MLSMNPTIELTPIYKVHPIFLYYFHCCDSKRIKNVVPETLKLK